MPLKLPGLKLPGLKLAALRKPALSRPVLGKPVLKPVLGKPGRIAQESVSLARRRVQPTAFTVTRQTVTAVVAYGVAYLLTGKDNGILAALTALLVVQVTLYHTLRTALQRVVAVVLGVLVALALSDTLGFTWWSLGITIAAALVVGHLLRLGDSILEVPISAMLILALPSQGAVSGRIISTLIGAAAGLASNLVLAPLRVQPAEEAVNDLGNRLADLLDEVSEDLASGRGLERTPDWLTRARALGDESEQVEDTLGQAEESVRFNPRSGVMADPRIYLRRRLEALEQVTVTVRGIARSLNDSVGLPNEISLLQDPDAARRIGNVLRELADVLRSYGRLARTKSVNRDELKANIDRHLAEAMQHHRAVADILRAEPAVSSSGWPLRGELVSQLDRLRTDLQPSAPRPAGPTGRPRATKGRRREAWRNRLRTMARAIHIRRSRP